MQTEIPRTTNDFNLINMLPSKCGDSKNLIFFFFSAYFPPFSGLQIILHILMPFVVARLMSLRLNELRGRCCDSAVLIAVYCVVLLLWESGHRQRVWRNFSIFHFSAVILTI
jgi:hypothetical protein